MRWYLSRPPRPPSFAYYVEAKYKFRPEFFAALRWNQQLFANVPDGRGGETRWSRDLWRVDASAAYRCAPHTQLKLQYSFKNESGPRGRSCALAAQFTIRF